MYQLINWVKITALATIYLISSLSMAHSQDLLDDVNLIFGSSLGYSTFAFPEKMDHDISFPSANLTAAAALDKWQLSLNAGFTLKDAGISEEEDTGTASRNDFDLTLGYSVTPNWTVFGGYKTGKTKMTFTSRDSEDEGTPDTHNESYSQTGPYFGGGYTHRFERAGSLNLSIAYAFLNSTNRFAANTDDDEEDEEEELEFDDLTGTIDGKMKGLSYALTWTMPLSGQMLFQTKFKINDYKQDLSHNGQQFRGINETFTTLHVGLAYVF